MCDGEIQLAEMMKAESLFYVAFFFGTCMLVAEQDCSLWVDERGHCSRDVGEEGEERDSEREIE